MSNNVAIGKLSANIVVFLVEVIGPTYVKSVSLATGNPSTMNVDDPVHIGAPHPNEKGPPHDPQVGPINPQHVSVILAANMLLSTRYKVNIVAFYFIIITFARSVTNCFVTTYFITYLLIICGL